MLRSSLRNWVCPPILSRTSQKSIGRSLSMSAESGIFSLPFRLCVCVGHDHTIASLPLGLEESTVGDFNKLVGAQSPREFRGGTSRGHGHRDGVQIGLEAPLANGQAQPLSDLLDLAQSAIRQDNDDLVSAIPSDFI